MTYPGQGWPDQNPQGGGWPDHGQPAGGWPQQPPPQQPPPGRPQFPPPQYQQPYGGQPNPGQPYPGQPYPGQPYGAQPGQPPYPTMQYPIGQGPYGPQPAQPKRKRTGLVVGVIVAVVVLAAGGLGTYFAFGRSSAAGSASPQDAATKLVSDVSNDDVIGLLGDLPPAESSLFRDASQGAADQFERLGILKSNDLKSATGGVTIKATGIQFASPVRINSHLAITNLVAGKITAGSNVASNYYTDTFLHQAFPHGLPKTQPQTLNIGDAVRELGHPIRIATVQVDGKWYPSLFYSIADAGLQAAHENWPSTPIPAVGAASADDAVRQFVQAALNSDVRGVIERTSPDEMAALHDAGQVLVDAARGGSPSGLRITSATFTDREVAGGTDAVLHGMTLAGNGDRITVTQAGGCYTLDGAQPGEHERFCASDLTKELESGDTEEFLPPALTNLLQDMVTGVMRNGVGVVATQVDDQWYVSPGRTFSQLALDLYGSISPSDFASLMQLAQTGGH
jgi:hypothetical protein